ncbi:MAG: hypothetical protein N2487_00115 [Verrucomicrobiae bacterium]|nr:hypothetical protein [Verrucomicrobiae bacterium]
MKKFLLLFTATCVIAACGYGLFQLYKLSRAEKETEGSEDKPVESRQFVTTNSAGQTIIKLSDEEQKKFGIEAKNLTETSKQNGFYAFGVAIDISSLVEHLTDLKTASINLDLAKRQFSREKTLYENGKNTPLKNVELAEAEVKKYEETIKNIQNRIALQWGEKISAQKDLESFLTPFLKNKQSLVRVDLMPGQLLENPPESVKISLLSDEKTSYTAEYFGVPKVVESGNFTKSFIYLIKGESLPVGMKVKALFESNQKIRGTFVPESAIIRLYGGLWVYKKTSADEFMRVPIKPDFPTEGGWILTNPLNAVDLIVVKGAQMLLSEELKSQIRLVE